MGAAGRRRLSEMRAGMPPLADAGRLHRHAHGSARCVLQPPTNHCGPTPDGRLALLVLGGGCAGLGPDVEEEALA